MDGKTHTDFGTIRKKDYLPITSVGLIQADTDVNTYATMSLGDLKCIKRSKYFQLTIQLLLV